MSEELENRITGMLAEKSYEQAFEFIVSGYKERLYWHIRNMVLSHDDTDDILQNTFIKIWKNLSKFEGKSQLYSWAYRIATNETLSFIDKKKRKSTDSLEDQEVIANGLMADEYFDGDRAEALLRAAVQQLPNKQKQVFNMKYFEALKYEEISVLLDTSVGALKASYHHAVNKIENYIKKNID